jgi:hypothetical protein
VNTFSHRHRSIEIEHLSPIFCKKTDIDDYINDFKLCYRLHPSNQIPLYD